MGKRQSLGATHALAEAQARRSARQVKELRADYWTPAQASREWAQLGTVYEPLIEEMFASLRALPRPASTAEAISALQAARVQLLERIEKRLLELGATPHPGDDEPTGN